MIPPFPSQDLAKLVLGYLAEEQLMTAYDEFLQASPYLDALKNEYDRIFMTSLRNILAEYRAVKILVETCKPFALRKKVFQCANLLEVVKLLISLVDANRLHDSITDKTSPDTQNPKPILRCEACTSLNLHVCVCKSKRTSSQLGSVHRTDSSDFESMVETTTLDDLPGNHVTVRKKVKVLDKECSTSQINVNMNSDIEHNVSNSNSTSSHKRSHDSNPRSAKLTVADNAESTQKIEEFNDILKKVCSGSSASTASSRSDCNSYSAPSVSKTILTADTFREFETGVCGTANVNNIPMNPSDLPLLLPVPRVIKTEEMSMRESINPQQMLLKVGTAHNNQVVKTKTNSSHAKRVISPVLQIQPKKPKPDDQRVTILSDIRVQDLSNKIKKPSVLKNATSTPVMQMQTIFINGTPAYAPAHSTVNENNFTKEEIMSMPTIILVPASAPSLRHGSVGQNLSNTHMATSHNITTVTFNRTQAPSLKPLTIDISSEEDLPNMPNVESNFAPEMKNRDIFDEKTAEVTRSVPKDNTIPSEKPSTPHMLPPLRKSSSTPRRNTHVRVLDFATPRRILHETINEHAQNFESPEPEVIISQSPNLNQVAIDAEDIGEKINCSPKITSINHVNSSSTKENNQSLKNVPIKKNNWDSDLRALIAAEQLIETKSQRTPKTPKLGKKSKKKKETLDSQIEKKTKEKCDEKTVKKRSTAKIKKSKQKAENVTVKVAEGEDKTDITMKPPINILSGEKSGNDQSQNKSNSEEQIDTPETERLSLQNAIGAKLNISDIFETPFKQALYDIQMETPKFVGPFIDEPMSDIKIMSIPTPKFLEDPKMACTPKPTQATPSSYCSRPTDYSSGSSYYKPDENDYIPVPEDLGCPIVFPHKNDELKAAKSDTYSTSEVDNKAKATVKSRPVRQCTKNVSYRNIVNPKMKERHDSVETASVSSDTMNGTHEKKIDTATDLTENKIKSGEQSKPVAKKKVSTKKRKSPVKKETPKNFMRIKPRRPSPLKKTSSLYSSVKKTIRKRTTSKDKNTHVTPVPVAAPTKSRRKSSTPRKLQCTETFHAVQMDDQQSTESINKSIENARSNLTPSVTEPDADRVHLHCSDDGSKDAKSKDVQDTSANETEDIIKIQEYIKTTQKESEGSLHIDLVKRGFDFETAKIIERDLLDTPPYNNQNTIVSYKEEIESKKDPAPLEKTLESDCSTHLQIHEDDEEESDEIEFSVHECNEESTNYVSFEYDETKEKTTNTHVSLKDKFCMEVCIDDGVTIRLRATSFGTLFDQEPQDTFDPKETECAVDSISNIDRLYTPLKDSMKAQCYEIFDSTLTSLDTPLKPCSANRNDKEERTVTEIVLEVEQIEEKLEVKHKADTKKRKRIRSGSGSDESLSDMKRTKPETKYLLDSASIQNIDIESVLSKLHGP